MLLRAGSSQYGGRHGLVKWGSGVFNCWEMLVYLYGSELLLNRGELGGHY